jgi:hypothetical protein
MMVPVMLPVPPMVVMPVGMPRRIVTIIARRQIDRPLYDHHLATLLCQMKGRSVARPADHNRGKANEQRQEPNGGSEHNPTSFLTLWTFLYENCNKQAQGRLKTRERSLRYDC